MLRPQLTFEIKRFLINLKYFLRGVWRLRKGHILAAIPACVVGGNLAFNLHHRASTTEAKSAVAFGVGICVGMLIEIAICDLTRLRQGWGEAMKAESESPDES